MTNEEAIKRLERFEKQALNEFIGEPEDYPALDMAIEALKGQGDRCITTSLRLWADKATENGLIDRKRILQSITDYCELHGVSVETWIVRLITEEPQVEALKGQKTGKWIQEKEGHFYHRYHCDNCGYYLIGAPTKFCPECGVYITDIELDMEVEHE